MTPSNIHADNRLRDIRDPIPAIRPQVGAFPALMFYEVHSNTANPFGRDNLGPTNSSLQDWGLPYQMLSQTMNLTPHLTANGSWFYVHRYAKYAANLIGLLLDKVNNGSSPHVLAALHRNIIFDMIGDNEIPYNEHSCVYKINHSTEHDIDRPRYDEEVLVAVFKLLMEQDKHDQPLCRKIALNFFRRCNGVIRDGFPLNHKLNYAIADGILDACPGHHIREADTALPTVLTNICGHVMNEWLHEHYPKAYTMWHPDGEKSDEANDWLQLNGGVELAVCINLTIRKFSSCLEEVTIAHNQHNYPVLATDQIIQLTNDISLPTTLTFANYIAQEQFDREMRSYNEVVASNGYTADDGFPTYPRFIKQRAMEDE